MGTVQGSQAEALRQHGEFQSKAWRLAHLIQQENATLLATHLGRTENFDCDPAELQRRAPTPGESAGRASHPSPPGQTALHCPNRPSSETGSPTATTWLLEHFSQLKHQNRSASRTLLDRLVIRPRRVT